MGVTATKRRAFLLACLLLLAGSLARPAFAKETEREQEYIVKYRVPRSEAPFDVVSERELERLLALDALVWHEPNSTLSLIDPAGRETADADDADWHLAMIGADETIAAGFTADGVRVGVIDSGVAAHPALAHCLAAGHNYIEGAADTSDTSDKVGHGTFVAGLIAGKTEDGFIGAAPGATIVPLKCTDTSSNVSLSSVCSAIYGGVDDYGCSVLNLSLGYKKDSQALKEAAEYAAEHGVLIVSAAGNAGTASVYYPAGYEEALGIGAVDASGKLYSGSNRNASVFLTAPGVGVTSTKSDGSFGKGTGTSYAVPLVSAAAAVLKGADPTLTWEETAAYLRLGAQDKGAEGWDSSFGWGVLNVAKSLQALRAFMTGTPLDAGAAVSFARLQPLSGAAKEAVNNTAEEQQAVCLLATYDEDGAFLGLVSETITLGPGERCDIAQPEGGALFSQFLCDAETLQPLTEAIIRR